MSLEFSTIFTFKLQIPAILQPLNGQHLFQTRFQLENIPGTSRYLFTMMEFGHPTKERDAADCAGSQKMNRQQATRTTYGDFRQPNPPQHLLFMPVQHIEATDATVGVQRLAELCMSGGQDPPKLWATQTGGYLNLHNLAQQYLYMEPHVRTGSSPELENRLHGNVCNMFL